MDLFDQELDDRVDFTDNTKSILERQISDEKLSNEQRGLLQNTAEQNQKKAFKAQIDLFEDTTNALRKIRGQSDDFSLNIEELLGIEDPIALNESIATLGLVERQRIRLLEIIREQRTATQDLKESQDELNESDKEQASLIEEIAIQQIALNEARETGANIEEIQERLSGQLREAEIEGLKNEISALSENSIARLSLEKDLNDKLLELEFERIKEAEEARKEELDKQKEARKEELDKQKEARKEELDKQKEAFSLLSDISRQRSQERIQAIDEELQAEQNRANFLQELAAQGNEDAENNLALTEKRQAKIELRRQQQIQRQERQELALTAIQTYSQKVQAEDTNALASTIADISVLRAFISSLPGFYEGTEDTGNSGFLMDEHGVITGYTHANERVFNARDNQVFGDLSNKEVTQIVSERKNPISQSDRISFSVVRELRELKNITKNKETYLGSDYDQFANAIVKKIQKGNKLEKIHTKNGSIWGS